MDAEQPNAGTQQLTRDPGVDQQPAWTADSKWILFSSSRFGAPNIFRRAADGSGSDERLTTAAYPQFPAFVAPGLGTIFGFDVNPSQTLASFSVSPTAEAGREPDPGLQTTDSDPSPVTVAVPDGHFVAYQSRESGTDDVFVRPFPNLADNVWQISANGGARPVWSRDGRTLFYVASPGEEIMRTAVHIDHALLNAEAPVRALERPYPLSSGPQDFDVAGARRTPPLDQGTASGCRRGGRRASGCCAAFDRRTSLGYGRPRPMTPDRWREVSRIYGAVLTKPEPDRPTALASLCANDAELRAEVESLLKSGTDAALIDRAATE